MTLVLGACNNEKGITPSVIESAANKFEFPQEGTPANVQAIFDDIYARYGTKVIYKDFTERDMNRGWMAPSTGSSATYAWDEIKDPAKLLKAAEILRDKIFNALPADKMKPVMRGVQYLYLCDNLRSVTQAGPVISEDVLPMYPSVALDGMGVNLQVNAADDDRTYRSYFPARILANLFDRAYFTGIFTLTDDFFNEMGKGSKPAINQQSYAHSNDGLVHENQEPTPEDYWAQRGMIPSPTMVSGRLEIGKHHVLGNYTYFPSFLANRPDASKAFLYLCMDPNWRTFGAEQGAIDNTLTGIYYNTRLLRRLEMFSDQMLEQGVDMAQICANIYAGTGIYTSPDKVYISGQVPASEERKYIYYERAE